MEIKVQITRTLKLEKTRSGSSYDDSESDDDSDFESQPSEIHGEFTWLKSFGQDVLLYLTCLTQLGTALECPAQQVKFNTDTRLVTLESDHMSFETDSMAEGTHGETFSRVAVDSEHDVYPPGEDTIPQQLWMDFVSRNDNTPLLLGKSTLEASDRVQSTDAQPRYTLPPSSESYREPSVLLCVNDFLDLDGASIPIPGLVRSDNSNSTWCSEDTLEDSWTTPFSRNPLPLDLLDPSSDLTADYVQSSMDCNSIL